jgi:hypothetical protein
MTELGSRILVVFLSLITTAATAPSSLATPQQNLQPGDVVLLALDCYICKAISKTTQSPFNHSGLVIDVAKSGSMGDVTLAQSLGDTSTLALDDFLAQAKSGSRYAVLRPAELQRIRSSDPARYQNLIRRLKSYFDSQMLGRKFDDEYLWDNIDADGQELLYCSEMIQKTLNHILLNPIPPVGMDYLIMWDFWSDYFKGNVPQGELGNSPASLAASEQMVMIYEDIVP